MAAIRHGSIVTESRRGVGFSFRNLPPSPAPHLIPLSFSASSPPRICARELIVLSCICFHAPRMVSRSWVGFLARQR
eukprot:4807103-Pyramimonas_sp.AAC.1